MPNKRGLYTGRGAASYLAGNKGKPIRGKLKHNGINKNQGDNNKLIIAETQLKH